MVIMEFKMEKCPVNDLCYLQRLCAGLCQLMLTGLSDLTLCVVIESDLAGACRAQQAPNGLSWTHFQTFLPIS